MLTMAIDAADYRHAAEILAEAKRVLLVSHERPDGDALGSLIALRSMLRAAGVDAEAVTFDFDPRSGRYAWLDAAVPVPRWPEDLSAETVGDLDAIVVLDTCSYGQLESFSEFLRASTATKIVLDHHVTRDELADVYLIDETAAATCVLLTEWADAAGWTVDATAELGLFVGMATDSGWFRFSNTDARTLRAAARLIEAGLRPDEIYQQLYLADSPARIRLLGKVIETLELHADGALATVHITRAMLDATGATPAESEDMVNEPQRIASVNVCALFVERDDGVVKASLRSKRDIDVAAVASSMGGGGHQRAAGLRRQGTLDEVKAHALLEAMSDADSGTGPPQKPG
jgi:phosphoesterase RecJ-like protein